jgi:hypothetical protein
MTDETFLLCRCVLPFYWEFFSFFGNFFFVFGEGFVDIPKIPLLVR